LWDGKRDQEMMAWELAKDLFFEPLLGFSVLTGGAVAIAAGAKELAWFGAALALVKRNSTGFGTTGDDGIDDFAVSLGHLGGVTLEVLGTKGGKDFMDGGHDRVPPSRD
jgi:crotonobetainyl-CoA:carnitine CoA-transferase CaiB-like acyl-CoA transferase